MSLYHINLMNALSLTFSCEDIMEKYDPNRFHFHLDLSGYRGPFSLMLIRKPEETRCASFSGSRARFHLCLRVNE
jgi:hypothetical protein